MTAMCSEGEKKEEAVKSVRTAMEYIEGELNKEGKKFFGGEDSIGYLDIAIGWISHWLPVWEEVGSMTILDPIKFPAITAWTANFTSHPVIKHSLPPHDKMLVSFHRLRKVLAPMFT
ncbi:hypothetical protein FNV43_RR01155 [Rhamnella rubrinervis]|nr:hypothetical protein FNV43_RR01155 [Rhamnella rubrinervis]